MTIYLDEKALRFLGYMFKRLFDVQGLSWNKETGENS